MHFRLSIAVNGRTEIKEDSTLNADLQHVLPTLYVSVLTGGVCSTLIFFPLSTLLSFSSFQSLVHFYFILLASLHFLSPSPPVSPFHFVLQTPEFTYSANRKTTGTH